MAKPHAKRAAILALSASGMTAGEISRRLNIARRTVYDTIKRGTLHDRPRSGRPITVTTPAVVEKVAKRFKRNGKRSMRLMAKQLGMSDGSMRIIYRRKLSNYPYKHRERHGLSDAQVKGRREKVPGLLARAARGEHLTTVFSDEKIFSIEQKVNRQNDRILASSPQAADAHGRNVDRISHPKSVMVFCCFTADGRAPLHFVSKEAKVRAKYYVEEIMEGCVLPWTEGHFGKRFWTFQQDGAPAHTAKLIQNWLADNVPNFIHKNEWPANSPDLNPLDYCVWSILEKEVGAKAYTSVEALKRVLVREWDKIPQKTLRDVIEAYPRRLRAVLKAKGAQIE